MGGVGAMAIDRAVALALGWEISEDPPWPGGTWVKEGKQWTSFSPSDHLQHAWRLVEHYIAQEWNVAVYTDENGWHCLLDRPGYPEYTPLGYGPSICWAICDAVLKERGQDDGVPGVFDTGNQGLHVGQEQAGPGAPDVGPVASCDSG